MAKPYKEFGKIPVMKTGKTVADWINDQLANDTVFSVEIFLRDGKTVWRVWFEDPAQYIDAH